MSKSFLIGTLLCLVIVGKLLYDSYFTEPKETPIMLESIAFLEQNRQKEGVITTESGLQYKVLAEGNGTDNPGPTDSVKVHYHGTFIDGRVFDSSVDRGEPISFGLNQVIKGWTEGLQLMVVGQKNRLFIPAELAYGSRGAGPIPGGAALIFDVELLGINE